MKNIFKIILWIAWIIVTSSTFAETKMCTMDYNPVCAKVQVQCIKAPCNPVYETFGNKCSMEANSLATYAYDWECKSDSTTWNNSWAITNVPNPASVFCAQNEWELNLDTWECKFKNGKICNEWALFRWECSANVDSKFVVNDIIINKETNLAKINLVYPKISNEIINNTVSDYMKNYLANFSKEIGTEVLSNNWKNELSSSYEINEVSNILALKITIYKFTGWAHGTTEIKTFNFNTKNGQELIIRNSNFIKKVSDYSIDYFSSLSDKKTINSDKDWINGWLKPTFDNFSNWLITWYYKENSKIYLKINFIFPQYQIAPYSDWIQTINIDMKNLK